MLLMLYHPYQTQWILSYLFLFAYQKGLLCLLFHYQQQKGLFDRFLPKFDFVCQNQSQVLQYLQVVFFVLQADCFLLNTHKH